MAAPPNARPGRSASARIWTAGLTASAVFGSMAVIGWAERPLRPSLRSGEGTAREPGAGVPGNEPTTEPVRVTVVVVHRSPAPAETAEPAAADLPVEVPAPSAPMAAMAAATTPVATTVTTAPPAPVRTAAPVVAVTAPPAPVTPPVMTRPGITRPVATTRPS